MSSCWFIIVCCTPCWGEALLPSKKVVFESFWIRVLKWRNHLCFWLNAIAIFLKKAALAQLQVFYCMPSCWFIIVCCTACWGEALLPSKKIVFESFGIRVFKYRNHLCFSLNAIATFYRKLPWLSCRFFYCMSSWRFIIVCCTACWGEALLP